MDIEEEVQAIHDVVSKHKYGHVDLIAKFYAIFPDADKACLMETGFALAVDRNGKHVAEFLWWEDRMLLRYDGVLVTTLEYLAMEGMKASQGGHNIELNDTDLNNEDKPIGG